MDKSKDFTFFCFCSIGDLNHFKSLTVCIMQIGNSSNVCYLFFLGSGNKSIRLNLCFKKKPACLPDFAHNSVFKQDPVRTSIVMPKANKAL